MVAASLMVACSGVQDPHHKRLTPVAAVPAAPTAVVDIPGLLNLSIDELSRPLGPPRPIPAGFVDPTLSVRSQTLDSTTLFQHHGLSIIASYDYRTRRVSDLLLLGSDENRLMSAAQLQLGADRYLVLPVFEARRPTQLLGLRVLAVLPGQ